MFARVLIVAAALASSQAETDAPGPDRLTSKFVDNPDFKGNVKVIQRKDIYWGPVNARWVVNLKEVSYAGIGCDDEDNGFMWHVHAKWAHDDKTEAYGPTDCGADFTGGHYDPTFGCGAASDNQGNGLCEAVGRGKASGDQQTCMIDTDTSTCEFGDQSGKLGRVKAETGKQAFNDPYFTNLQNVQDLSIVFHCGDGKRVACAKLQNLLMEDPRDIPIGPIIPDIPNIPCLGCSKDENGCNPTTGYSRFCPGGCEGVEPNANGAVCVQPWAVPKGCEASCAPEKPDMPGADYDANGCKPSTGYSLYCPSCTSAEPNQIGVTCLQPFNIPEGCENCAPDGAPGECGQATDGGYELCDNKCTGVSGDNANGVPNRCVQPFKLENTFPECCKKNKDCSTPKGNKCGWK